MSADSALRSRSGDAPAKRRISDILRGDVGEPTPPVAPAPPVAPSEGGPLRREVGLRHDASPRRETALPLSSPLAAPPARQLGATRIAKVRAPRNTKKLLLLIVLVAEGLGVALVPAYFRAGLEGKRSALATDLRFLNGASKRFREQHNGRMPGLDEDSNVDEERLVRQLTLPTDARGQVLPGGPCGPYLKAGIPPNPWNGSADVKIVSTASLPATDDSSGWMFHVPTGQFTSNARDGGS